MSTITDPAAKGSAAMACVNGVPLLREGETVAREELGQRACTELLRQAAQRAGLLDAADVPVDGIVSERASRAIEELLARTLAFEAPAEADCRRYHAAHAARYRRGERAKVRHILFGVTPGTDVGALRRQAEATLLEVRCHDGSGDDRFGRAARDLSNCPSGAERGALGWIERRDCAPEFADAIFGRDEIGVLPQLVHTRFGLHVVEVQARDPGEDLPYEAVRDAVAGTLQRQRYVTELRRHLGRLAAAAVLDGVALEAFQRPLDNGEA